MGPRLSSTSRGSLGPNDFRHSDGATLAPTGHLAASSLEIGGFLAAALDRFSFFLVLFFQASDDVDRVSGLDEVARRCERHELWFREGGVGLVPVGFGNMLEQVGFGAG